MLIGEMLEEIERLRERVERAIKAYDDIVYVEELNATAKRIEREYMEAVERERNRKIGSSAARLGLGIAGHVFGSKDLLSASSREEGYGVVRIAERDRKFEVVNFSERARELGVDSSYLMAQYNSMGL